MPKIDTNTTFSDKQSIGGGTATVVSTNIVDFRSAYRRFGNGAREAYINIAGLSALTSGGAPTFQLVWKTSPNEDMSAADVILETHVYTLAQLQEQGGVLSIPVSAAFLEPERYNQLEYEVVNTFNGGGITTWIGEREGTVIPTPEARSL